jgi:hypothetical protein
MTLADFYSDNGFGQVDAQGRRAYPEYPPLNTKLQELYKHIPSDSPTLAPILGQLDLARVHQEQGYLVETATALEQADQLLDLALQRHAGSKRWLIVLAVVLAAIGAAVIWQRSKKRRRNLPPPRSRRRKRLPPPKKAPDPYTDDDADEDDDGESGDEEGDDE